MKKAFFPLIIFIICVNTMVGQETDFRPPFNYKLYLSGTFAELRGSHFHSGIDIKTKQTIGHPVYAIEDGWISRVKVRAYGFGHALYITHPGGHTSVYAHLSKFEGKIADVVEQKQYAKESFKINFYPGQNKYPVKKSDIIGYSGNSGSSGGPHLHFEIRDAVTQKPTNALLYGFDIEDNIAPVLQRLRIYPVGEGAAVNGNPQPQSMYIFKKGKVNHLNTSDVKVSGKIAFGIQTYDQLDGSYNHNGPYRVSMYADDELFWEFKADRFSFSETRYLNAMIDYASYKQNRHRYYQSYKKPGNRLSLIAVKNDGLIAFHPGMKKNIRIEVEDVAGNLSEVNFTLKGGALLKTKKQLRGKLMHYNTPNSFKGEGVSISVPAGALYDTLDFRYHFDEMPNYGYSKIHYLHNENVPLHKYATISVKVDRLINNGLKDKLTLVRIDPKGNKHEEDGNWNNGWISTKTRDLGAYVVMADTIKPRIKALNIFKGKKISNQDPIRFTVTDDLSGISYYRGEIDGEWVLFKYFPSRNKLRYDNEKQLSKGSHELKLVVSDDKNNTSVFQTTFIIE